MNAKKTRPIMAVIVVILIIIIAAVGLLVNRFMPSNETIDAKTYFDIESDTQAAIVVNHEVIEEKAELVDDHIYLSQSAVSQYISSRFYHDSESNTILYTLPDETISLAIGSAEYEVGGETKQEEVPILVEQNDTVYIALDFLKQYTDMSCLEYEEPNRVVIYTDTKEVTTAKASADYKVRKKGGIKSPILTEGAKGDALVCLETMENWTKVATEDGYVGYVRNKEIGETEEQAITFNCSGPQYTNISREDKLCIGWHLMTNKSQNDALAEKISGCTGLNVISPTWFTLADTSGKLQSRVSASYVEEAHNAGLEVWALIENVNADVDTTSTLASAKARRKMIRQMMRAAGKAGFDGINIDLENISEECAPHYLQFIRELSVECRAAGLVLSVDDPIPASYNTYYDRAEQAAVVDYVINMGYDEHYSGSDEAGSVASLPFVKDSIEDSLKEVPKEKLINALPFYTRLWKEPFGSSNIESQAMGMDEASAYVEEHAMDTYWDATLGQNVAETQDDEAIYQIWLEDEQSLEEKMKLVKEYELAGAAFWQLGFQRNTVWEIIGEYLQ